MVARSPAPLPCSACHHGTVPTYTRSAATFTDDGLGPTVDAPCLRCLGTGSEPCALCGDAPATSTQDGRPVCNDCRRGSCDACGHNEAVSHHDASSASPEGSFCRTCLASCSKHWCHPSECGCPIEICCTLCAAPMATIRAGEPEPPTVCEGCRRASASLAETLPAPAGEERAS